MPAPVAPLDAAAHATPPPAGGVRTAVGAPRREHGAAPRRLPRTPAEAAAAPLSADGPGAVTEYVRTATGAPQREHGTAPRRLPDPDDPATLNTLVEGHTTP
ncbi:hypothetical protein ACFP1Z_23120 [Streptomyces gamaensis]|uniref:Uncharacterized protein n=1 Tax=Streptomyces gamaensis TaxID=1763542 RepID=A0ABW0Z7N7_9ACTN